jgi:hypothetical protein
MPFIGNQPALSYTSFAKQDFTTSVTTSYTLDNPVANANELALFINFVRQEPTTAYSASGTSLTLTSATSATDDMYCVYLGKAVQTVNPPNGSVGTSQLDSSLDFSSKTITLASNMKNTPRFFATLSSNQSIADNGWIKVICDTEVIDSDSAYDPSTGRFTVPSGKGGQYTFSCAVDTAGLDSGEICMVVLYLNGSFSALGMGKFQSSAAAEDGPVTTTFMRSLSAGDYIEMYMYQNSGSAQNTRSDRTYFGGYKIIE